MRNDIFKKMLDMGYQDVQEINDFIFAKNKNDIFIKIIYFNGCRSINVNRLEYEDGHAYSYFIDLLRNEEEFKLEKYLTLSAMDFSKEKRLKLS